MIKLKSELKTSSGVRSWKSVVLGALFLALFLLTRGLLVERWRGQWGVSHWTHRMTAKGEIFELSRMWPQPSAHGLAFSNELHRVLDQLSPGLNRYAGNISAIVIQEPGIARRGSQEPNPLLAYQADFEGTWQDVEVQVQQAQPALESLRRILKNPPPDQGYDLVGTLEKCGIPNFVPIRRAAQALQTAAIYDLHRGDLMGAKNNLVALAGFKQLYAEDATLVSYMIRVAVLGLSIDTAWDALQADGWTDAQLAELQPAFQCDKLLAQLPRAMEAEHALRLFEYHWISSHAYLDWVVRYQPINQAFGQNIPESPQVLATRYYREWVSHPLWKFAWADQEQAEYLKTAQRELDALREAVKTVSSRTLSLSPLAATMGA